MGMGHDEELVRDLKRRKNGVLDTLYNTYAPMLLSVCLRYCGNRQDAEDVLHDGFIKILKHIHTFKSISSGSFEGWMKRIIINTALNSLRDQTRSRQLLDIDPIQEKIPDEPKEENGWEYLHDKIGKERIMQMICELPPGYRTVFNLYVFEEYSHKEIAKELQFSENTSKSQLSKARALLRKKIYEVMEKQKV
ncbi:MAG: RNA polymerase sigma factor [Bacteroidales bacterium]|nr:RNA polymerase sigma factor [Bacteroidales bacterium]